MLERSDVNCGIHHIIWQPRVLNLLIERIDYHGEEGNLSIAFHMAGIATLAAEVAAETGS